MQSPQDGRRPPAQSPADSRRFTLARGPDERPLQFDGEILAEAESNSGSASVLRAAVYRSNRGQYIAEFSKRDQGSAGLTGKAAVFNELDSAIAWFRPGKLTTALLKKLGRWDAEVLEESASAGDINMFSVDELQILLVEPNETLSAEYKGWIDLGDTHGRATLAKAAIAIANHGGGVIVLGMAREEENGPLKSTPRPAEIDRYTQDDVNQAVNRFADPEFHCELLFANHPETNVEHAFESVPGGISVPVMSRRDCNGVIAARKCYIRKPGPRSEEPLDGQEWRELLERCVQAGRENMLDAIRTIVHGRAGSAPARVQRSSALANFTETARARWAHLVSKLPPDDQARFPHGHYELGFEITGGKPLSTLSEVRRAMQQAGSVKHTGWPPFIGMTRPEYVPRIVDGAIEAWLGLPVERVLGRGPAHCDFWRADAAGRLVQLRGYDEDEVDGREPGKWTDITLPVWRVGDPLLFVGRLAEFFGENTSILVRCRFLGLQGRTLASINSRRWMFEDRQCADNEVVLERQVTRAQVRDNLVEILHSLLTPLYERFAFFELSEQLVADEVGKLMSGRF